MIACSTPKSVAAVIGATAASFEVAAREARALEALLRSRESLTAFDIHCIHRAGVEVAREALALGKVLATLDPANPPRFADQEAV